MKLLVTHNKQYWYSIVSGAESSNMHISTSKKYKAHDSTVKALRSSMVNVERVSWNEEKTIFTIKSKNGTKVLESAKFLNPEIAAQMYQALKEFAQDTSPKHYYYRGVYKQL